MLQLVIDHGEPCRGHRANLLAKDMTQVGVAVKYGPASGSSSEDLRIIIIIIICALPL